MIEKKIEFTYQVRHSARRKTVSICVYPDNRVVITAPKGLSQKNISQIVEKRSDWIRGKIQSNLLKAQNAPAQKQYQSGEKLLYLGREYTLRIERGCPRSVALENGSICVRLEFDENGNYKPSAVQNQLYKWYITRALQEVKRRIGLHGEKIGVKPQKVTLKSMRSRWGSCSSNGRISLAWNIIMAPEEIIDYLIVHELCHIIHHNHSAEYWNLVASIIPEYRQRRTWLLKNGHSLSL